jgi:F-type H+-transporting ATPase subunit b
VSLLELLGPAQAWASAAADAEHHAPPVSDVIYPAINFIIYAAIMYYFAVPLVQSFLRTRRDEIVETIAQASRKMQQAEALVNEYKAKLAGVEQETQAIQTSLRQEGESEKVKLLSEAQKLAVKIRDDARFLADQEFKIARQKLREELAEHAEATAEELVRKNITEADQGRLAGQFIQDIGPAR